LAEAILTLWRNPDRRRQMAEAARGHALRFDIGRTAEELQAAYQELA
jgi:glycosyltransferase involved in cell wall biosynthesis